MTSIWPSSSKWLPQSWGQVHRYLYWPVLSTFFRVLAYTLYPVWLGRLTHLLREAQSHWQPFCLHSQLCKNDARAAYQKNSDAKKLRRIFQVPMKTGPFSAGVNLWSYRTVTFKNGGHCVRALRCHQGIYFVLELQKCTCTQVHYEVQYLVLEDKYIASSPVAALICSMGT